MIILLKLKILFVMKMKFFSALDEKMNVNIFKLSNNRLFKIKSDSSQFFNNRIRSK